MKGLGTTYSIFLVVEVMVVALAIRRWRGPVSSARQSERNMEVADNSYLLKGVIASSAVLPFLFGSFFFTLVCSHEFRIAKSGVVRDVMGALISVGLVVLLASIVCNVSILIARKPEWAIPPHLRNGGSLYGPGRR